AETAAKHRPDIFVFSIVQWLNGIKINLGFLKHLKLKHPELLLIADGTQYLGTAPFNLSESAIDVLGASGYKWLLAGFGNGFMATKAAAQQRVRPVTIGFNSAENFQSKATGTTFIKHFEPGHQDTFNYGSLQQGIQLLEDVGLADIAVRTRSLSHTAKAEFAARGLLSPAVLGREGHSAIFNIKGGAETFKKLKGLNICCSARGGGIRVSFHFYNSENDLKNLLRAL
ncbi:MAG: aminotransferase class V-fold PLP-dependent enzyme, partial [Marinirhabdus sp.]